MSISHDDVEHLIRLLEASQFDQLHLELDGLKLDLRRRGAGAPAAFAPAAARPAAPVAAPAAPAAAPAKPAAAQAPAAAAGLREVKAPMLGTYYCAPKPGAEPFVRVGSRVEPDTVIGIVEVMKLMNSVSAGVRGEVVELVAADAQLVEYDQVLLRVRPD